jgi:hypothetical protein
LLPIAFTPASLDIARNVEQQQRRVSDRGGEPVGRFALGHDSLDEAQFFNELAPQRSRAAA